MKAKPAKGPFAKKVTELREKKGLCKNGVSGVSESYIQKIENQNFIPSGKVIAALASAFDGNVEDLKKLAEQQHGSSHLGSLPARTAKDSGRNPPIHPESATPRKQRATEWYRRMAEREMRLVVNNVFTVMRDWQRGERDVLKHFLKKEANARPEKLCANNQLKPHQNLSSLLRIFTEMALDLEDGRVDTERLRNLLGSDFIWWTDFLGNFVKCYAEQPASLKEQPDPPWVSAIPKLIEFFPKPSTAPESTGGDSNCNFIRATAPTARPDFAGRKKELAELKAFVATNIRKSAVTVITGSPGAGKTQLARQFIEESCDDYDLICWIGSSSQGSYAKTSLQQSQDIRTIAVSEKVAGAGDENVKSKTLLTLLARKFASYARRLFVFDNVDSPETFKEVSELAAGSHVIITSVLQRWDSVGAGMKIDLDQRPLDESDGATFLLQRSSRPGTDREAACRVGRKLGWHLLALEQAAAFVGWRGISFGEYLKRLTEQPAKLLGESAPKEYGKSAAATFAILIGDLKSRSPLAFKMLCLASCFAPDAVPVKLIWEQRKLVKFLVNARSKDFDAFEKACLVPLRELSLLMPAMSAQSGDEEVRRVHRVVVALLTDVHGKAEMQNLLPAAAALLESALGPRQIFNDLDVWRRKPGLFSNVATVVDVLLKDKTPVPASIAGELIRRLSIAYEHSAQFEASQKLLDAGIKWMEAKANGASGKKKKDWQKALAELHHRHGGLHSALASEHAWKEDSAKSKQERWKAVEAHKHSVKIYEEVYGKESLVTWTHRRCLGCMYLNVGEIAEARKLAAPAALVRSRHVRKLLRSKQQFIFNLSRPACERLDEESNKQLRLLAGEFGILGAAAMLRQRYKLAEGYFRRELFILEAIDDGQVGFPIASSAVRLVEARKALGIQTDKRELEERARQILTTHPNAKYVRYNCRLNVPKARQDLGGAYPSDDLAPFLKQG